MRLAIGALVASHPDDALPMAEDQSRKAGTLGTWWTLSAVFGI
jgi:hypothetical protein